MESASTRVKRQSKLLSLSNFEQRDELEEVSDFFNVQHLVKSKFIGLSIFDFPDETVY